MSDLTPIIDRFKRDRAFEAVICERHAAEREVLDLRRTLDKLTAENRALRAKLAMMRALRRRPRILRFLRRAA